MAVGKKKSLKKGGKKGAKKKVVDPFSKKDCCDVKAPALFFTKDRKTLVTRTQGTKIASYSATFKHTNDLGFVWSKVARTPPKDLITVCLSLKEAEKLRSIREQKPRHY
ncbi:small ribosomal subunit protein eS1-like [Myotis daubentonii]|uniref:small ribosomal subunit protein eS1-like n=1 Tax=Myotis daubentonii TaxID=98922 RepID=UPI002873471D|nr:small ribosomal subunit protein eS1-like [Myotis daubentonii]